jgi:O-antigen ligase
MKSIFSTMNWNRVFIYLLFISSTFSIAGTEASIAMLYLLALIRWIWYRPLTQLENPFLWVTLFFMAASVLSGLLNDYETDHLMALRDNWRLLLPLLLAGILSEVNEEQLIWVFFGFVFFIAVYGIIQYFTGVDWLRQDGQEMTTQYMPGSSAENAVFHGKGNFSHHLTYGGFLLIAFPLFASLLFCKDWNPFSRIITAIIAIVVLFGIGASLGRSIWLGTAAAIAVLLFRLSPKLMLSLTIVMIAGGTYFYSQLNDSQIQNSVPTNRLEALEQRFISGFMLKSNQDRILMWETGIAAIKDHFWLGIGYDNDAVIMPDYREKISKSTGHRFHNKAGIGVHNIYLQTWVNFGLFGILGYMGILAVFLFQTIRGLLKTTAYTYENSILWAGLAGVCGFMIAGFFENNFRDGEVQAMLLILMGLCFHQIQKKKDRIFMS